MLLLVCSLLLPCLYCNEANQSVCTCTCTYMCVTQTKQGPTGNTAS